MRGPACPASGGEPGTHPFGSKFHKGSAHVFLISEVSVPSKRPGTVEMLTKYLCTLNDRRMGGSWLGTFGARALMPVESGS